MDQRSGRGFRDGQPCDVEALADFFAGLSDQTRARYGPHEFGRATAEQLCASIDPNQTVRFVAVSQEGENSRFIGYMILSRQIGSSDRHRYGTCLSAEDAACFAPVIADVFQDQGVGTPMARHVLHCAEQMGIRQVILMGGVHADNDRAVHFYLNLGFRRQKEFWTEQPMGRWNVDMIELPLGRSSPATNRLPQKSDF